MWYLKLIKAIFFFIVEISFDNKDDWNLKSGNFRPIAWVRFITFCCALVVIGMLTQHTTTLTANNLALRKKLAKVTQERSQLCIRDETTEPGTVTVKEPSDKK